MAEKITPIPVPPLSVEMQSMLETCERVRQDMLKVCGCSHLELDDQQRRDALRLQTLMESI